jgi:hypothetical protein
MQRHYGLDWLRIGAFGILIFYHIGMFFVPWDWHVKTAHPIPGVAIPMLASHAWRLALLFVVSGYASRALLGRSTGLGDFLKNRSARLLIPLVFGMIVVIPVQPWIQLSTQFGYTHGFWHFVAHDYFRFGSLHGIVLPTWQHLWFVAYLWAYTALLCAAMALTGKRSLQPLFDRLFAGQAALLVPMAWLILDKTILLPGVRDTYDLFFDWAAHAVYVPSFLFGFALAGSPATLKAIGRLWKPAAILGVAGYIIVATIEWRWPGFEMPSHGVVVLDRIAIAVETWAPIIAFIGLADRFLNRDHKWRPMLTEAVFPFYIIHQTVIVVVGWAILPLHLSALTEFVILVPATIAGCWAFYLGGREVTWLRPLIGLRMAKRAASAKRVGHDDIKQLDLAGSRWSWSARAREDCA